ncbi:PadR family transcriptional regulator [Paenibacillus sp. GP183]|uniref:PadR family transcriptional regulator n=1 Tax=Paenibacillus sp. GP183 TaxID=1882751 RepID=UPI0008971B16|nr:PadR family transcriptional regulator [Paenibacillus sp. GP183]SEB90933.1 transcriptional regulator, PadR family [Paenibacillus sp. GP183]
MNTLSFGLLSLLNKSSRTGYELMRQIHLFWQVQHSQIYPLLAKLEKAGLVEFVIVEQSDKPDKKVYSITQSGKDALREWISMPAADPVTRDELLLKVYSISLSDRSAAIKLIRERACFHQEKLESLNQSLNKIKAESGMEAAELNLQSSYFGSYLIVHKAIMVHQANLEWCRWVESIIDIEPR